MLSAYSSIQTPSTAFIQNHLTSCTEIKSEDTPWLSGIRGTGMTLWDALLHQGAPGLGCDPASPPQLTPPSSLVLDGGTGGSR